MSTYYTEAQSERDFALSALAAGARIGYDEASTTWAITEEGPDHPAITYLDTPRIGEVPLPDGAVAEWQDGGVTEENIAAGGNSPALFHRFWLSPTDPCRLVYCQGQWAVEAEGD